MKKDEAVVVLSIFGVVFFSIGVLVSSQDIGVKFSDVAGAIATLIAAYAGAHAAFALQQSKAKEELINRNIAGANRLLSNYYFQFNLLLQTKRDWVSLADASPAPHIFMPAIGHLDIDKYKINIQDIDFLLDPSSFNIYFNISLEIDRARVAIDMVNKRSEFMVNVIQPTLEMAGIKHGAAHSYRAIENAIGTAKTEILRSYTQAAIKQINEGIESMLDAKKELRAKLIETYPGAHFVDFEKP